MTFILIPLNDLVFETKIGTLVRSSRTRLTALRASIVDVGLLNPLVVTKQKSKYLVINGRKRLMVLRQLAKSKVYMKSLHKVPCG
jgi:ParB-like chromosome segregation protein Spo0J